MTARGTPGEHGVLREEAFDRVAEGATVVGLIQRHHADRLVAGHVSGHALRQRSAVLRRLAVRVGVLVLVLVGGAGIRCTLRLGVWGASRSRSGILAAGVGIAGLLAGGGVGRAGVLAVLAILWRGRLRVGIIRGLGVLTVFRGRLGRLGRLSRLRRCIGTVFRCRRVGRGGLCCRGRAGGLAVGGLVGLGVLAVFWCGWNGLGGMLQLHGLQRLSGLFRLQIRLVVLGCGPELVGIGHDLPFIDWRLHHHCLRFRGV